MMQRAAVDPHLTVLLTMPIVTAAPTGGSPFLRAEKRRRGVRGDEDPEAHSNHRKKLAPCAYVVRRVKKTGVERGNPTEKGGHVRHCSARTRTNAIPYGTEASAAG